MKKVFLFSICVFLFLFSCTINNEEFYKDAIVKGVYDIADLGSSEVVQLEGDWIFIPNRFISPSDDFSKYKRFEKINFSWDKYGDNLSVYGYATYAIKIKNISSDGVYAIKAPDCHCAFTAFFNGEEFYRYGIVGTTKKTEVFELEAPFMVLPTRGVKEAYLVIHISNFNYSTSGFPNIIEIGFYSTIVGKKNKSVLVFSILAGILIVTAVFFLSLYIFYPKEKNSLFFGLLCANFGLRTCCYDEYLLRAIFPNISPIFLYKIGYMTLSLAIIFASLFIHELFGKIKNRTLYIIFIPGIIYILINMFAPILWSNILLPYAQIYVLLLAIYNLILAIIAAFNKNRYSYLFLLGLFLFLLVGVRDVLISNRIISGVFLSHLGVLALIGPMAIIVLQLFKNTFESVTKITEQIETTNEALAKFVPSEFMNFLNKKHVDIRLGDNILKDMYIAFIHLGFYTELKTEKERLSVLQIYNQTLVDINPIIEKHKGFIDKYLTEGLMVLFYGDANNVINCMLEIKAYVNRENIEREIHNLPKITLASGVHYGRLMLGTIGEEERMDSTVISDVVNVASRLHFYALKKKINILVSEAIKKKSNISDFEDINFIYNGLVRFRGKEVPIPIYEVTEV